MGILNVVLLVLFIITAVLLVLLVLIQTEEGDGLGGVFAGGSSSAFGSRSGTILSKSSSVLGAVFLALSFSLALLNRTPSDKGVEAAGRKTSIEQTSDWWKSDAPLSTETNSDIEILPPDANETSPQAGTPSGESSSGESSTDENR